MLYRQTIVSYDIEETKVRTRLRKDLMSLGMVPVQKSVMWGYLNNAEEHAVLEVLRKLGISSDDGDSVFLAHADLESAMSSTVFGIPSSLFRHPDEDLFV